MIGGGIDATYEMSESNDDIILHYVFAITSRFNNIN